MYNVYLLLQAFSHEYLLIYESISDSIVSKTKVFILYILNIMSVLIVLIELSFISTQHSGRLVNWHFEVREKLKQNLLCKKFTFFQLWAFNHFKPTLKLIHQFYEVIKTILWYVLYDIKLLSLWQDSILFI